MYLKSIWSSDRPFTRTIDHSPFEVIECWWPPRKFFERSKDKCRDVVFGRIWVRLTELFNFTKGVQRHVYLALVERVKLWTTIQHEDASHSEARSKDNARYTVLWTARDSWGSMERSVCVTRVTIRIYETCEVGKGARATNCIIFTSIAGSPRWFLYRNSHYLYSS